jgi:hypothetical protein
MTIGPLEMFYLLAFVAAGVGGIYWRWGAVIGKVRDDLAGHKLHVAERYVTKAGMQEQTSQIMRAIEGVGSRIDGVHERLDRAFEASKVTRR